MPIRFAAARAAQHLTLARHLCVRLARSAANDNASDRAGAHDPLLRDALKHFARHGLGAAETARRAAERAFFAGDRRGYDYWLGICRTLDRRMAGALAARVDRLAR
jgi:hypothetical protein